VWLCFGDDVFVARLCVQSRVWRELVSLGIFGTALDTQVNLRLVKIANSCESSASIFRVSDRAVP
jgi:hypothetical protein